MDKANRIIAGLELAIRAYTSICGLSGMSTISKDITCLSQHNLSRRC